MTRSTRISLRSSTMPQRCLASARSWRDERGMLSLAALLMVLFVTAMAWAVIGVGKTLYVREGLQDASDAAAYSAAVFHAKGMNLIALINIIMAVLVALLLALRMAQTVLQIVAIAMFALAYFGGATAVAGSGAQSLASTLNTVFKNAKNIIEPILEGLHLLQEATSVVVPAVALADGMIEVVKHHPPAEGALALPASLTLPVEADEFKRTCDEAQTYVVDGVMLASGLAAIRPEAVTAPIGAGLNALAELTAVFLCGTGEGAAPQYEQKMDVRVPRPARLDSCDTDVQSRECSEGQRELELSRPEQNSGRCTSQCDYDGPYERMAREARTICDPSNGDPLKSFVWQERTVTTTKRRQGRKWIEEREEGPTTLKKGDDPPCGRKGGVDQAWNRDSGARGRKDPHPLCSGKTTPGRNGSERKVEVLRVFSCVRTQTRSFPVGDSGDAFGFGSSDSGSGQGSGSGSGEEGEQSSGSDSDDKSPHRVEADLKMGDDTFQIRAVSFGPQPGPGAAQGWIDLIDRNQTKHGGAVGGAGLLEVLHQVGRISVAQSEYYFEGSKHPTDWLWALGWTARMKRFRLPQGQDAEQEDQKRQDRASRSSDSIARFGSDQGGFSPPGCGSLCEGGLLDSVDSLEGLIKH